MRGLVDLRAELSDEPATKSSPQGGPMVRIGE